MCKIFFRFSDSISIKSVVGEIKTNRLFYQDNEWITVKTKRIFQSQLISDEFLIHKSDICQIEILEPNEFLTIDKRDLKISEIHLETISITSGTSKTEV